MPKRRPKGRKNANLAGGPAPARAPVGREDEQLSAVTMWLPPGTVATLRHLSERQTRPLWRVVVVAIDIYAKAVEPLSEP